MTTFAKGVKYRELHWYFF